MIVVVGSPRAQASGDGRVGASGLGAEIAFAAARAGAAVQVVGRVGEDVTGEAVLLDLAQQGVGHIAVLRDAGRATGEEPAQPSDDLVDELDAGLGGSNDTPTIDAADLQLALSYLPDYRVVVVAETLTPDAMQVAVGAVGWAGSPLVVVGRTEDLAGLPEDVTVFAPPDDGATGAFATMVGTYAVGLDRGDDPRAAFEAAAAAVGSNVTE